MYIFSSGIIRVNIFLCTYLEFYVHPRPLASAGLIFRRGALHSPMARFRLFHHVLFPISLSSSTPTISFFRVSSLSFTPYDFISLHPRTWNAFTWTHPSYCFFLSLADSIIALSFSFFNLQLADTLSSLLR